MEFIGTLYNRTINAKSMRDLKRKASIIANGYFKPYDTMEVKETESGTEFGLCRINRLFPSNEIIYGEWS